MRSAFFSSPLLEPNARIRAFNAELFPDLEASVQATPSLSAACTSKFVKNAPEDGIIRSFGDSPSSPTRKGSHDVSFAPPSALTDITSKTVDASVIFPISILPNRKTFASNAAGHSTAPPNHRPARLPFSSGKMGFVLSSRS
jgi:hypothetical protein